jgi:hypothetical protein
MMKSLPVSRRALWIAGLLTLLLIVTPVVLAQTGGGFGLTWFTVDSGGGLSQGGTYTVQGTVGQPDTSILSGGAYTLSGGFWGELVLRPYDVYLPIVIRL